MEVYLVRHGTCTSKEDDPERSLTQKGELEVNRVATHLAKCYVQPTRIVHSEKLRARQTAEIISKHLTIGGDVTRIDGLMPNDDPEIAKLLIKESDGALMIVGHLPHLTRLASLLLTDDPDNEVVEFRAGSVVCLSKDERWLVKWAISPDLL